MAIEIAIKQKGFFKKKITLSMIKDLLDSHTILGERDSNSAYVFYELDSDNIDDINIVVQNPNHLGRGFMVRKKSKDIEVILNVPCTDQDVEDFFDFVSKTCTFFKTDYCTMDEMKEVKLAEFSIARQHISEWNKEQLNHYIHDFHKNKNTFIILGVKNPIYVPEPLLTEWCNLNTDNLERTFSTYIHNKQREDLYYMKPFFAQKDDEIVGVYCLTETTDCIVPKKAFIPHITSVLPEGIVPTAWNVSILYINDNNLEDIHQLPYQVFIDKISHLKLEEYDDLHWILRNPTKEFLEGLLK